MQDLISWFFESLKQAAREILKDPTRVYSITLGGVNAKRMLFLISAGILDYARAYLKKRFGIDAIITYVSRLEVINSLYILVADRRYYKRAKDLIKKVRDQLNIYTMQSFEYVI